MFAAWYEIKPSININVVQFDILMIISIPLNLFNRFNPFNEIVLSFHYDLFDCMIRMFFSIIIPWGKCIRKRCTNECHLYSLKSKRFLYKRKCDFPCHDDVIIRLGKDDVIVDLGTVVTRCLNDVILNDGQLSWNLRVRTSSSLCFVFRLSSIIAHSIHRGLSTQYGWRKRWIPSLLPYHVQHAPRFYLKP